MIEQLSANKCIHTRHTQWYLRKLHIYQQREVYMLYMYKRVGRLTVHAVNQWDVRM